MSFPLKQGLKLFYPCSTPAQGGEGLACPVGQNRYVFIALERSARGATQLLILKDRWFATRLWQSVKSADYKAF